MRRGLILALVLVLAAALGGGGYWAWQGGLFAKDKPAAVEAPAPQPTPAPPATKLATLFPTADKQAVYDLDDGTRSTELVLVDGSRVVQTYNGVVYATWFLSPEAGLLRADPKGSGVLLRYLPPELKDGLVWKQAVNSETVWFRLNQQVECQSFLTALAPAECWQLQVLNKKELTTFTFATGLGAAGAVATNATAPAESFRKTLKSFGPAPQMSAEQRKAVLDKGMAPTALPQAPVAEATVAEFEAAVRGQTGK